MRLPQGRRQRVALSLALILIAPLATGAITVCVWDALMRTTGGLSQARFTVPYLAGAVLGAAGSAASALILPIRYWLRIASAVGCLLAVFFGFPLFAGLANAVLHSAFGIGPEISPY